MYCSVTSVAQCSVVSCRGSVAAVLAVAVVVVVV